MTGITIMLVNFKRISQSITWTLPSDF